MQSRPLVAPKGTPKEIIKALTAACDESSKNQELREKIENLGEVYHYLSGAELVKYVNKTNQQVTEAVKANTDRFLKK